MMSSMRGDEEVSVGSICIETSLGAAEGSSGGRQVRCQQLPYTVDIVLIYLATHRGRRGRFTFVVNCGLHPITAVRHKIENSIRRILDHRDGTARRGKKVGVTRWCEPMHHLALDAELDRVILEQVRGPRAGAQREPCRVVFAICGDDAATTPLEAPPQHGLVGMHFCAARGGQAKMSVHATLWVEHSSAWLQKSSDIVWQGESGKARSHRAGSEHLVREMMFLRAAKGAGNEHSITPPDHETACLVKQPSGSASLQVSPQRVRSLHKRHITRMLVIRLAYDPRQAVRGAHVVGWREAVETGDPHATLREVQERGAPHCTEANDNHVGGVCHVDGDCMGEGTESIAGARRAGISARIAFTRQRSSIVGAWRLRRPTPTTSAER